MDHVVIYGVGSPIVVDVQEGLTRAGVAIAAAVRNLQCEKLTAEMLALPFLAPFFSPANRQKVVREAFGLGFRYGFSLIDPTVPRSLSLMHGSGLFVSAGCTLGAASEFGEWALLTGAQALGTMRASETLSRLGRARS